MSISAALCRVYAASDLQLNRDYPPSATKPARILSWMLPPQSTIFRCVLGALTGRAVAHISSRRREQCRLPTEAAYANLKLLPYQLWSSALWYDILSADDRQSRVHTTMYIRGGSNVVRAGFLAL